MIINEEGLIILGIICSFFSFFIGLHIGQAINTFARKVDILWKIDILLYRNRKTKDILESKDR